MFCGLPFSGKSTLARDLSDGLGVAHVEIDRINTERSIGLDGAAIGADDWNETYAESFRQLESYLRAGESVIHDATNYSRDQRQRLRSIANAVGAETVIVYVAVPGAEVRRRWRANRVSGERHDVRETDFLNVIDGFEEPNDDEGIVIRVDGLQSIAEQSARLNSSPS